jgi:hypothetical protein
MRNLSAVREELLQIMDHWGGMAMIKMQHHAAKLALLNEI